MRILYPTAMVAALAFLPTSHAAAQSAGDLLKNYTPRIRGVQIETPKAADIEKCSREVVSEGKGSSWVVYGPAGQVLRRFADTDGDKKVDQFRYYNLGVEVYRDIDSDGDELIDQFRWLNSGGTRWGIDKDGDGKIDSWKRLSAQEAAQVAVNSMIAGDTKLLSTVLVSSDDIDALGLKPEYARRAKAAVSDLPAKVKAATGKSKTLGSTSKWMRFDAQTPGLIPAGRVADQDLVVFQNAMGMVEVGKDPALVHVGELVQVGNVWKLLSVPSPADEKQIASVSVLMRPELKNPGSEPGPVDPKTEALVRKLRETDKNAPGPGASPRKIADYNKTRAGILTDLMKLTTEADAQDEWTRQLADGIAVAVQGGTWTDGVKLIQDLEKQIDKDPTRSKRDIFSYVVYRRILAEYGAASQNGAVAERQDAQETLLENLAAFARKYPRAPDTADALFELAKNQEFQGKIEQAEQSYSKLERNHGSKVPGKIAKGAKYRLGLEGKTISLSGTDFNKRRIDIAQYKNRVVLVVFWTTWCTPCTAELPRLKQLHAKYQRNGFEILGVNLDTEGAPIADYLRKHKPSWNHIQDKGGLTGDIAQQFGIISVPTMFLLDKRGKVIARSLSVDDLVEGLPNVLRGKPLKAKKGTVPPRNARKR